MVAQELMEHLPLPDLVDASRWQRLQDHFASVLGMPIRTVSPSHQLLVNPSWPPGLDAEQVIQWFKVGEELGQLLPLNDPPREISSFTTPVGTTCAVVPIRETADHFIAYFVVGPMVVGPREDELEFRRRVHAMGLEAQALWPLVLSLKLYTFAGIRSALNLLEEVGTSIVQLAAQGRRLAAILPSGSPVDRAVVAYHTDRILHALLDIASLATKADGGSVMVYDPRSQTLQIRAGHGLSDGVVTGTRLKRGEGIAGLAVTQRSIWLLDADTDDPRLRERMHRPELAASLVAPLVYDASSEPIGVLNLRTRDPQRRFTPEHMELLRRLLDLSGAALGSLHSVFARTPPGTSS